MTQQVIDIGSAPDDATGDPLRTSFDKTNDNFTELYAKGATEGLWNFNQTSSDTSTTPVSGRFKTNSGNYRTATQIAIHGITIQGIDRSSTLRTLLVGDLIQCQDKSNPAAWCRYSLQSLPVDHGTWFQLNVTFQADGGVASGDNQEIIFVFTASSGSAAVGAPVGAEYITSTTDATLTAERVLTDTATVTWDRTTAGQIKATAIVSGGGTSAPQGRLTLLTVTPVMMTTQSSKTTIYYTPYVGNTLPIYNGTSMLMTTFAELSVATTDTTKSPAAIGVSKVNDWFVWNDAGTLRLGHGPDWTDDTVRSAGTALVMINGILLNAVAITNGPAAQRGTYVGTTRSDAISTLNWGLGGQAAGGIAIFLGVWNAYNRINIYAESGDTTSSWTISGVLRMMNGSASLRASAVFGLAEDFAVATVIGNCNAVSDITFFPMLNWVSDTPTIGLRGITFSNASSHNASTGITGNIVLGFNYWQAMEWAGGAGSSAVVAVGQPGLAFQARM